MGSDWQQSGRSTQSGAIGDGDELRRDARSADAGALTVPVGGTPFDLREAVGELLGSGADGPAPESSLLEAADLLERAIEGGQVDAATEMWASIRLAETHLQLGDDVTAREWAQRAQDLGDPTAGALLERIALPVLLNRDTIVSKARAATFRLVCRTWKGDERRGLGVLVKGGAILTHGGLVAGLSDRYAITVEQLDGSRPRTAELLWFSACPLDRGASHQLSHSLAALRIEGFLGDSAQSVSIAEPQSAGRLIAIGDRGAVRDGGIRELLSEPGWAFEHSIAIDAGDTGMPLFDRYARLVGVSASGADSAGPSASVARRAIAQVARSMTTHDDERLRCCVGCGRPTQRQVDECATCGWNESAPRARSGFHPVLVAADGGALEHAGVATGDVADVGIELDFPDHVSTWLAYEEFGSDLDWSRTGADGPYGVAAMLHRWVFGCGLGEDVISTFGLQPSIASMVDSLRVSRVDPFAHHEVSLDGVGALPVAAAVAAATGACVFYLRSVRPGAEQLALWRAQLGEVELVRGWPSAHAVAGGAKGRGLVFVAQLATTAAISWCMCGPAQGSGPGTRWLDLLGSCLERLDQRSPLAAPAHGAELWQQAAAAADRRSRIDATRPQASVDREAAVLDGAAALGYLLAMQRSLCATPESAVYPDRGEFQVGEARRVIGQRCDRALDVLRVRMSALTGDPNTVRSATASVVEMDHRDLL